MSNKLKIYSCGYGGTMALGHGTSENISEFKLIENFNDLKIIKT